MILLLTRNYPSIRNMFVSFQKFVLHVVPVLLVFICLSSPQVRAESWVTQYEAQSRLLQKDWPIGQMSLWREKSGARGNFTPVTGLFEQSGDSCRAVAFQFVRPDKVSFRGTGDVCHTVEGSIRFGITRMIEE